jgi:uncharacterized protein GlcG (DUF336 family)
VKEREDSMARGRFFILTVAVSLMLCGAAAAQFTITGEAARRTNDKISINADTARKLAMVCEDIARRHNSQMVVVVLDPYGQVVHQHRMDGIGYVSIIAAQNKARTALLTRQPSVVLANRQHQDPFTETHMFQYELTVQEGGFPIIVDGQIIGAIGVGGIPGNQRTPTYDEQTCARDALIAVIGPQPPLIPERPAAPGGGGGRGAQAQ